MEYGIKQELTHNRDLDFSLRHREYGHFTPAVDIDFMMMELDFGRVVALIEYKQFNAPELNLNHTSIDGIRDLANNVRGQIPAFVIYYYKPTWNFHLVPLNPAAKKMIKEPTTMSEFNFIHFLYFLRRPNKNDLQSKPPEKYLENKSHIKLPDDVALPKYYNYQ